MFTGSTGGEMDESQLARQMFDCASTLFPICRSITGDGLRQSLSHISSIVPLTIHEVPSGTAVFDWTVPPEWNISQAWIKDPSGNRIVDLKDSNLHVVNYSMPFHGKLSLDELRPHLFTLPEQPDWIPYRTSYYKETWGFCLSQNQLEAMPQGEYEVCIDSSLAPGSLSYGELLIPGDSTEEVLISCHICHPSLANDNLSGIAVATFLAKHLQSSNHRLSYRFLFIPATIGSITWLSRNEANLGNIRHGVVLACLGDSGKLTYKRCRAKCSLIDRAAEHCLRHQGDHEIFEFSPYGYDERQYCSPGVNLPVGRLSRTPHGCFDEYHTSADNLDFIVPEQLARSLYTCLEIFEVIEHDQRYLNLKPMGEPQLSRYGLYSTIGGQADSPGLQTALLWVLNLSDGEHSLLDIAERSGLKFQQIKLAADALLEHGLLKKTQ